MAIYYVSSGVTSCGVSLLEGDSMCVLSGGVADFTTVNSGAHIFVSSGGIATNTAVYSSGHISVSSGGSMSDTLVDIGGTLYVWDGGKARNVVENGGHVDFVNGNDVSFVENIIVGLVVSGPYTASVHSSTTAVETVVTGGCFYVYDGGLAVNTSADCGGWIYLYGGTATNTTLDQDGGMHVGGVAKDTVVHSGGMLNLYTSGTLTGRTIIENGAFVTVAEGATLDFDISELAPSNEALVDNLSMLYDDHTYSTEPVYPNYTLTVSDSQSSGSYNLAVGAAGFDRTLTVRNTLGEALGTLSVGETGSFCGAAYMLDVSNNNLILTVGGSTVDNNTNIYVDNSYTEESTPSYSPITGEALVFGVNAFATISGGTVPAVPEDGYTLYVTDVYLGTSSSTDTSIILGRSDHTVYDAYILYSVVSNFSVVPRTAGTYFADSDGTLNVYVDGTSFGSNLYAFGAIANVNFIGDYEITVMNSSMQYLDRKSVV